MRHILLGAAIAVFSAAFAQAQNDDAPAKQPPQHTGLKDSSGKPITDTSRDPHRAYYGNTYSNYHPGLSEGHHWWNADGSEIYFQANWLPEGVVLLKMIDGHHDSFIDGGLWCSHNARAMPTAGTAAARAARPQGAYGTNQASDDPAKPAPTRPRPAAFSRSCASPVAGISGEQIPDAMPGEHWVKLHLSSHLRDAREQYVLLPGHQ